MIAAADVILLWFTGLSFCVWIYSDDAKGTEMERDWEILTELW